MSNTTDTVRKICEESGIPCHEDEMVPAGFHSLSSGLNMAEGEHDLTVDDLIKLMPEIEAKFPKDKMCPNPADVCPETFAALMNVCTTVVDSPPMSLFPYITLHVRYDVEPWKMHPCTCPRRPS